MSSSRAAAAAAALAAAPPSPLLVLARELADSGVASLWHSEQHLEVQFDAANLPYAGPVQVHCSTDSASYLGVVASGGLRVPPTLRRRAAELLAAVNSGVVAAGACFELDAADGELRARVSVGLSARAGAAAAAARQLVDAPWKAALLDAAAHYHVLAVALARLLAPRTGGADAFARMEPAQLQTVAAAIIAELLLTA